MCSYFTSQCFFCHQCTFFKCTTDTNTNYHWRACIWPSIFHSCKNCLFHSFNSFCRFQHEHSAHILTSKSFWCDFYFYLIAGNDFCMQNCRCIVFCIFTDQWIFHNRFSQVSIYIALSYTFIDCIFKQTSFKMYILTNF